MSSKAEEKAKIWPLAAFNVFQHASAPVERCQAGVTQLHGDIVDGCCRRCQSDRTDGHAGGQ